MPLPEAVIRQLERTVGAAKVVHRPHDLVIFERDGSIAGASPDAVVFADTTEEVAGVVRIAAAHGIPLVPRGAGTGLSGGAVTLHGGIALSLVRMRRILSIDPVAGNALVEPGVVNSDLGAAAARHGLFYAPDPSSQKACTVGGNAAENSGGPHCLFYGVTSNHVLGMEVVLADGSVRWLGGEALDRPGIDLLGLLVGSEGTLGVITKILVRLLPLPESIATVRAAFSDIETACGAVSSIIAHGIVPAALEMMDRVTITAVEATYHAGYPDDAGAVLICEVEGIEENTSEQMEAITRILTAGEAYDLRLAADAEERELLWASRKGAIGALGRIRPNYYLHDGVVPRTTLARVLHRVGQVGEEYGFPVANVFHAGDGNLHPLLLFDARQAGVLERVEMAGEEILLACIEAGGTLSGEHGIGIEKSAFMPWIFSPDDIAAMQAVKQTLDPAQQLNPGKIFPPPGTRPRLRPRVGIAAEASWW